MKRELIDNATIKPLLTPTVTPLSAGTTTGLWVERVNFLSALIGLATGAVTGSPSAQSVTITVQTADDASGTNATNLKDINGNDITLALTAGSTASDIDVDLLGGKAYVGISIVTAFTGGTAPTVPVNAFVVLGDPRDTRQ